MRVKVKICAVNPHPHASHETRDPPTMANSRADGRAARPGLAASQCVPGADGQQAHCGSWVPCPANSREGQVPLVRGVGSRVRYTELWQAVLVLGALDWKLASGGCAGQARWRASLPHHLQRVYPLQQSGGTMASAAPSTSVRPEAAAVITVSNRMRESVAFVTVTCATTSSPTAHGDLRHVQLEWHAPSADMGSNRHGLRSLLQSPPSCLDHNARPVQGTWQPRGGVAVAAARSLSAPGFGAHGCASGSHT